MITTHRHRNDAEIFNFFMCFPLLIGSYGIYIDYRSRRCCLLSSDSYCIKSCASKIYAFFRQIDQKNLR